MSEDINITQHERPYRVTAICEAPTASATPLDVQVGGDHYKSMAIQPVEFCMRNKLNFCQSSAIKYICRYKNKNGEQDIDKAIHFLQILKEIEYGTE